MIKTGMIKSREYLCFAKRDSNGVTIRDSYGNLVPEYREADVYRVRITDNGSIYEWCIHHDFSLSKMWAISDCDTGLKLFREYETRKEAYKEINEYNFEWFIRQRNTDFYMKMFRNKEEL